MLDRDIRPTLLRAVREDHPGATLFEEFPVCRKGRADLVAVNAALWGYEIKSERDTLSRLPIQIERYECICDFSTVVSAERHLKNVKQLIPSHWGVVSVSGPADNCFLEEVRKPKRNPNRQIDHIIRLLWKTECVKVLRSHGIAVSRNSSVRAIWTMLQGLPIVDLDVSVRCALKERHTLEFAAQRMTDDGLGTTGPTL